MVSVGYVVLALVDDTGVYESYFAYTWTCNGQTIQQGDIACQVFQVPRVPEELEWNWNILQRYKLSKGTNFRDFAIFWRSRKFIQ